MKTVEVIVEHAGKNLSAYIEGAPVITVGNDMREIEENMKEKGQNVVCRMYNELSEYIKEKDVKLETRLFDENDMRELEQNTIMLKALSGYVTRAIETAQEIKVPITLEEIDTMMPKKKDYYLKYSKLQFLKRNEAVLAGGMSVIKFTI